LKAACEQAKIDLSRAERTAVACSAVAIGSDGAPLDADLDLARAELETLTAPLLERCLGKCLGLLERHSLSPAAVGRVVLVGGPTLMPALRARIGDAFGGRLAEGIDPMTIVARGAALYAGIAGLDARPPAADAAARAAGGLAVRLEHPAVTADEAPFVIGRFLPLPGGQLPAAVRLERLDDGWSSPTCEVTPEGTFAVQVELVRQERNRFRLAALGSDGATVPLQVDELGIVHGIAIADPPLARTVGVALSNDTVHVYFEKGTPLPARRTIVHETAWRVSPKSGKDVLAIPVIQGEFRTAHFNRLIGSLSIPAAGLARELPAGARVELTLELDRSGQLMARALLPALGQTFEEVVHVLVPRASLETLGQELAAAEERVADLRRRGFVSNQPDVVRALAGASGVLVEARAGIEAARGGDADAAARVERLLLDLNGQLEGVEQRLSWPELTAQAERWIGRALHWVPQFGSDAEQQLLDRALTALERARQAGDAAEVERQIGAMRRVASSAAHRDPETPLRVLDWCEAHAADANDPQRVAALLAKGRAAAEKRQTEALRAIVRELDGCFPGQDARGRSLGSGIW
jgi:molecular chaperone DnaK